MLESGALKMGVSKHRSRRKEEREEEGGVCGQVTKGAAREEPGTFPLGKGTGIL